MRGVEQLGKSWRTIVKRLPPGADGKLRSDSSVRNRWQRLVGKEADSSNDADSPSLSPCKQSSTPEMLSLPPLAMQSEPGSSQPGTPTKRWFLGMEGKKGEVHDVELSKLLSKLLRYTAFEERIASPEGWMLLSAARQRINSISEHQYSDVDIRKMIQLNDKQRFELRGGASGTTEIRATYTTGPYRELMRARYDLFRSYSDRHGSDRFRSWNLSASHLASYRSVEDDDFCKDLLATLPFVTEQSGTQPVVPAREHQMTTGLFGNPPAQATTLHRPGHLTEDDAEALLARMGDMLPRSEVKAW